jgi:hypothetical protein
MDRSLFSRRFLCAVVLPLLIVTVGCPPENGDPNGNLGPPTINITQGGANVPPGIATVVFGDTALGGGGTELSFAIENDGEGNLEIAALDGLSIGGTDADLFTLGTQPDTIVPAGESTVFTIIFTPDSIGDKSASVTLIGTHPDLEPYTFDLAGNGIGPTISIVRGMQSVVRGGTESFGSVCVGTQNDLTFTVANAGNVDLHLVGSPIPLEITGTDASAFAVVTQPATIISPGYSSLFVLLFIASDTSAKSAILTIENNDPLASNFSVSISATGIVPAARLPETGFTLSFASYDDGFYKMGAAWPIPRFTDNGNGTITDDLTGLMWDQNGSTFGQLTWTDALSDISSYTLGGHTDWRMPNIVEIRSLIRWQENDSSVWLGNQGFMNVQSSPDTINYYYWTATRSGVGNALLFKMIDGTQYTGGDDTIQASVWAVRSDTVGTVSLPKTGQTTSYAAGDDGDLEIGVAWPSPRFVDNGFGALTDLLTGLMWQQSPSGDPDRERFSGAMRYANDAELGGYSDWRTPNVNEFLSLVSHGEVSNVEWLTSQGFTGWTGGARWSSTPYWVAYVGSGSLYEFGSSVYNYLWVVRGGL